MQDCELLHWLCSLLNVLMIHCSQERKPLTRWGGTTRENEFWVRINAREAGREWSGERPPAGWFREDAIYFWLLGFYSMLPCLAILASLAYLAMF